MKEAITGNILTVKYDGRRFTGNIHVPGRADAMVTLVLPDQRSCPSVYIFFVKPFFLSATVTVSYVAFRCFKPSLDKIT